MSRPPAFLTSVGRPMHCTSYLKSQLKSRCLTARFGSLSDHTETYTTQKNTKCDKFFCLTFDFLDFCNLCLCYHTFTNDTAGPEDASKLQKDLDIINSMAEQVANGVQCCQMLCSLCITHARSLHQYRANTLNNTILQDSDSHTYLGVNISHDFARNSHINIIAANANTTLGFLRRNLYSCTSQML